MADQNQQIGIRITASDEASGTFAKVAASAGELKVALGEVGEKFKNLGEAAVLGFSVFKFAEQISETIELAASLDKLSQKTGIAVEELSKLQYAAKLNSVDSDLLSEALKKLSVNISAAANGNKVQAEVFKGLGISLRDATGNVKPVNEVFLELADRFKASASGAEKTAVAWGEMGKRGNELIPLLNKGSESIRALGTEAEKLGIVMGEEFAKTAEEFETNITRINTAGKGLIVTLAGDLVKGLSEAARAMADAAIEGGKLAGIIAGIQTLFTGTDQYKNDKALVEQTDKMLSVEKEISELRKSGAAIDAAQLAYKQKELVVIQAQLATTQAYRKVLDDAATSREKALAEKPTKTSSQVAAGAAALARATNTNQETEYDKLNKRIQERIALQEQELQQQLPLTEQQKFDLKLTTDIALAKDKLSSVEKQRLVTAQAQSTANQKELDERKALATMWAKQYAQALETQSEWDKELERLSGVLKASELSLRAYSEAVDDNIALVQREASLSGASAADRAIAIEQFRIELDLRKKIQAINDNQDLEQPDKQRLIAGLTASAQRDINNVFNKAILDQWQGAVDKFDNIFQQGFEDALGAGNESFAKWTSNLWKTFKQDLVDQIYKAFLQPIAIQLSASIVGLTGLALPTAAAGATGLSQLGSAGGVASGVNSFLNTSTALGTFGGAASSTAQGIFLGTGELSSLGLGEALSAGGSAVAAGQVAAGLGTLAGALAPIGVGVAAIAALLHGNGGTPTSTTGDSNATFNPLGKAITQNVFGPTSWTPTPSANSESVVAQLEQTYLAAAANLGIKAAQTNFSYSGNTGKDGKNPQFGLGGAAGASSFYQSETAATTDAIKLASSRAVLAALEGSDLPKYLQGVFDGLTPSTATQAQIDAALADAQAIADVHKAIDGLGAAAAGLKDISADGLNALVSFSGGLSQFTSNFNTYYNAFATDAEKKTALIANITSTLQKAGANINADDIAHATRDQFKAAVEAAGQNLATTAGQQLYAALLSVAGAFDQLVPAAAAASTAVTDMTAILATRQSWQDKIDVAAGRLTQQQVDLQNELAGTTDDTTQALIRQYYAQLQLNQAATDAAAAIAAAAQSSKDAIAHAQQLQSEARAAADTAVGNALSAVSRAVNAEKTQLQDSFNATDAALAAQQADLNTAISAAQSLGNSLHSTLGALASQLVNPQAAQQDALAQIQRALLTAQSGGQVQLTDSLSQALQTVSKISPNDYSTKADYLRAVGQTNSAVAALSKITDSTLTTDQQQLKVLQDTRDANKKALDQQLKALDDQYAAAQEQVDALHGIDDSVKTVSQAIAALAAALGVAKALSPEATVASTFSSFALANSGKGNVSTYTSAYLAGLSTPEAARQELAGVYGAAYSGDPKFATTGYLDPAKLATFAEQIAALTTYFGTLSTAQRDALDHGTKTFAKALGIPGFAVGTNWVPQDMLAMVHQGEAIVPAPFNPERYAMASGNTALVAEIKALRAEVAQLRVLAAEGNVHAATTVDRLNGQQQRPWLVEVTNTVKTS